MDGLNVEKIRVLEWPSGRKPSEWGWVYGVGWVMFVGGFVAGCAVRQAWVVVGVAGMVGIMVFHGWKGRRQMEPVAEQLRERRGFPVEAWGDSERAGFAEEVGRIVAEEVGWPNGYFVPGDPLEIAIYCPAGDGGEGLEIARKFEKKFGRKMVFVGMETFGEWVDRNVGR